MFVKRDLFSQVGRVDHRLEVLGYAGETAFQALARQRGQRAEARPYEHLIVNWGGHISHAAFAIEQKNRAEAEFGPLQTSLSFHPFKLECLPAPFAKREAYSNNYYWQQYVSLPQFDDFANSSPLFRVLVKTRAAWTTCRVLVIAALAALVSRRRRHFFLSVKRQKVRDLTIGAQVLSDFIRDGAVSRGYSELNSSFIRNLYECYLVAYYWLDVSPRIDFKKILFSNPETTYRNEIARRALLKRGATEIFSDRWKQGRFTLANSHKFGYELALCPLSVQTAANIELARTELMSRLAGASKYVYMAEDVDSRSIVQRRREGQSPQKTMRPKAVVFLHCVSDAQFYFGDDDCFADLDDWLDCSLKMLIDKGYDVYVKAHPMMFSLHNTQHYPPDVRYAHHLAKEKGLDWGKVGEGEIAQSLRDPRIWIVDYRVSIRSLKQSLGDFVVITHHGTVSTEAVGLRIPVIWSNANPARNFPEFGFSYRNIMEYGKLLEQFRDAKLLVDDKRFENCLRYLAAAKNDYHILLWTEQSRLAGQSIFANADVSEDMMLSADPEARPELHAAIGELYGVGSIPSVAIWDGKPDER